MAALSVQWEDTRAEVSPSPQAARRQGIGQMGESWLERVPATSPASPQSPRERAEERTGTPAASLLPRLVNRGASGRDPGLEQGIGHAADHHREVEHVAVALDADDRTAGFGWR